MAKVEYEFDPFDLVGISKSDIKRGDVASALEDVSNYVLESVLSFVGDETSPVSGRGKFKRLNKDYAHKKDEEGYTPEPNLMASGDMLDAVKVVKRGSKLVLTLDKSQQDKADGHNNHSGASDLPVRRFIPLNDKSSDETFKPAILKGIKQILKDYIED
jgi:hypothetical protein